MSLLVLSGNLFSLSLGITAAIGAMLFLYTMQLGVFVAIVLTLAVCAAICAVQGAIVGAWAANPIVVTIGAGAIQQGVVLALNGSAGVFPNGHAGSFQFLVAPELGVPFSVFVFAAAVLVGEVVLRCTRFGRETYLLGESRRAAQAAALPVGGIVIGVFAAAGACAGIAGVLLGAQSGHGVLLLQGTLTFDALAAVLVGGSAISGGHGSILRTALGALVISTITDLLLIRGYAEGVQLLVKGLLVVIVVTLVQARRRETT
jgi:simple sugar transport system permease protein/ribose transport system permease protein